MSEHNLEKLLGGFAANPLTPEERSLLYAAALQDQQLFNALADEQALKELLSDPAVRRKLLETLKRPNTSESGGSLPWWAWFKRPAGLAFAGCLAAVIFVLAFGTRIYQESLERSARSVATEDVTQAKPTVQAPQPADSPRSPEAESRLKADAPVESTKRERSTQTTQEKQPAVNAARDNVLPLRERDETRKQAQAPVAAPGNAAGGTTCCPDCGTALVVRDWYEIRAYKLTAEGKCGHCGAAIAGRFEAFREPFGARRIPVRIAAAG